MTDDVKSFVSWLGLLGLPTIFTMTCWCIRACRNFAKEFQILQSAQKAQMRSQLLHQFYELKDNVDKGEQVPSDEVDDWNNQYKAYHQLVGDNEVLNKRKEEILEFPTYERK